VLAFFIESNTRIVYIVILKVDSSAWINYIKKYKYTFFYIRIGKKKVQKKAVD
jgi:hypothetical protein